MAARKGSTRFGWCITGHHKDCTREIPSGEYTCDCHCHGVESKHADTDEAEDNDSLPAGDLHADADVETP